MSASDVHRRFQTPAWIYKKRSSDIAPKPFTMIAADYASLFITPLAA
jgi:hypothetical protein